MNFNTFPPVYIREIEAQAQRDVQNENTQKNEQLNKLEKSQKSIGSDTGSWISGGAGLGLIIGFFACAGVCNSSGFGDGIITALSCAFIGGVIGVVLFFVDVISAPGRKSTIENEIIQSSRNSENKTLNIQRIKEQKVSEYLKKFENEAQNQSVRLAESELAKDVIEWMTDGFYKTINSADRRPHVEQINVPFVFNIFKEKITCNLGTFDFELKRCRDLQDPIEQTALARAVASTIQLNLVMKYPKDASGTDTSITINYSYMDNYVIASITYVAPNGNFQKVKEW